MGFDLTNERIQDTYEQLLQISGSTIVDGTGSVAPVVLTSASYADFAVTASYAKNAGDIDTSSLTPLSTFNAYTSSNDSTFTAYTSSTSASLADISNQIDAIEAGSGSADWDLLTNKPSGLMSGSAQTVANLEGGDIVANNIRLDQAFGNIISSSALNLFRFGDVSGVIGQEDTFIVGLGVSGEQTKITMTGSDMELIGNVSATDLTLSGDLVVNGTASFAYLESITGSAKIIGDAYIILNNDTPTQRYAGLVVQDSGSTNNTASFEFDGQTNDWFYEYTDDGGATAEYGVVMFGPGYNTRGSHVYPSNNTILKGTGDHHIVDSNITDDGTSVTVSTSLTASAFKGDGSGLTNIQSKLGNGVGASSIITQNLTSQDATSAASFGIAIGDTAQIINSNSTNAIAIGRDSAVNNGLEAVALGYAARGYADYSIAIGRNPEASGQDSIAIGRGADASGIRSIAIGSGSSTTSADEINIGDIFKYDGSDTITLDSTNLLFNSSGTVNNNAINLGIEGGSVNGSYSSVFGSTYSNISVGNACIAGGYNNSISAGTNNAIMGGAEGNTINGGSYSAIFGGASNTLSAGDTSFILGGYQNRVTAGARNGVIGGNAAISAHDFSVVIGRQSFTSTAAYTTYVANLDASGSATISGSITANGQINTPLFAGSVASSTSSVDFDNGNFATLSLSAATFVANPSNLKSGTTYTLIITSGSQVSNYGTSWKFAGGTQPTLSDGTDILTCVSDGTNLYATALANFS